MGARGKDKQRGHEKEQPECQQSTSRAQYEINTEMTVSSSFVRLNGATSRAKASFIRHSVASYVRGLSGATGCMLCCVLDNAAGSFISGIRNIWLCTK